MIVHNLDQDILGTDREVEAENGNWVSRRLVLADDRVGFSFHDTIIRAGTETYIHYANHIEAVYCVAGTRSRPQKTRPSIAGFFCGRSMPACRYDTV
jgi:hypothetical protein